MGSPGRAGRSSRRARFAAPRTASAPPASRAAPSPTGPGGSAGRSRRSLAHGHGPMASLAMLARCHVHLVGTSNPENLGSVARLLENFGVATVLTLTAPRVAPDDHRALVVGRAARERLAAARVVATLDEAVRDCAFVVGFSARRGNERPGVSLRVLAATLAERAPA